MQAIQGGQNLDFSLSKVPLSELKALHVAVERNIIVQGSPTPMVRSIDDAKKLVALVHLNKGEIQRSIFDRPDVEVNRVERFIFAESNRLERDHSTSSGSHTLARKSKAPTDNGRANDVRKSRSIEKSRTRETRSRSREPRSRSKERRSRSEETRRRSKEKRNYSYSRTRSQGADQVSRDRRSQEKRDKRRSEERPAQGKSHSRDRSRDREQSKEIYEPNKSYQNRERNTLVPKRRCVTPLRPSGYRPDSPDLRTRSRSRGRSEKATSRRSRLRSRDRRLPSPSHSRSRSPRCEKTLTRRPSRSPRRSRSPTGYSVKRGDRSSEKRWSRSPARQPKRKRSRSPNSKHIRYRTPPYRRRSRSRSSHPPDVTFERDGRRAGRTSRGRTPVMKADEIEDAALYNFEYYGGIPRAKFGIPGPIRLGSSPMPPFHPPTCFRCGFHPSALNPMMYPRYPLNPMMYPRVLYNRPRVGRPAAAPVGGGGGDAPKTPPLAVGVTGAAEGAGAERNEGGVIGADKGIIIV